MNHLFTLKAGVILLALLICQIEIKAQSTSNLDTSRTRAMNIDTTKKTNNGVVVKSDTTLVVRAGATLVQRSDTTLVINADSALIKKFNEMVAAKQVQVQAKKADDALTPKNTTNTTTLKSDSSSQANNALVKTNAAQVTKPDSATVKPVNAPVTTAPVPAATTATTVAATTGALTNSAAAKPVSVPATNTGTTTGTTTPAATTDNALAKKPDSASVANNNAGQSTTQQTNAGDATVAKPDSALSAKLDTTLTKKSDTTAKKSDTSMTKKTDTSLMVKDTTAQEIKAQNVFLELGGPGLAISANYDARFHKERNGWGYRVGVGFFTSGGNTVETIPFQINYLIGEHSSMLELGAGTTFLNSTGTNVGTSKWEFDKVTGFIGTASIGYRYQPQKKGLSFRIAFVPILYDEGLIPAGGISVGYTFK